MCIMHLKMEPKSNNLKIQLCIFKKNQSTNYLLDMKKNVDILALIDSLITTDNHIKTIFLWIIEDCEVLLPEFCLDLIL